jgi:L-seryl-tRNA(Ser) seleniumtransferase
MKQESMRGIPPVHRFLSEAQIAAYEPLLGKENVKARVAEVLDVVRAAGGGVPSFSDLCGRITARLESDERELLAAVVNATGIILHTNLGRAPLAPSALRAIETIGAGYSNLEYDLGEGRRGSRYSHAGALVREITGAAGALVVNNCAAAVLLILDTFAKGREAVASRGELIEIGGGFRLPDVLQRSGAALVEVGTTNKTYLADYERALSPQTALLLRTHLSNYSIEGFTHTVEPRELVALGRRAGVPVAEDLGSGALVDTRDYGLPHERTVQEAVADGIDLVAFSADKMLGGPQAGIVVGSAVLIARLRANPLLRALRADKLTFAALGQTLRLYLSPGGVREIPLFAMLAATRAELRARAEAYVSEIDGAQIVQSVAYAGGGTPARTGIPSIAVSLTRACGAEEAARRLRFGKPPIAARVDDGRVLLDMRTIFPPQDAAVIDALRLL